MRVIIFIPLNQTGANNTLLQSSGGTNVFWTPLVTLKASLLPSWLCHYGSNEKLYTASSRNIKIIARPDRTRDQIFFYLVTLGIQNDVK